MCYDFKIDFLLRVVTSCCLTFGGMWRCRSIAVARVFALVVRCSDVMLFVYCRVGKNRDTGGSPRRCRGGLCRMALNGPL